MQKKLILAVAAICFAMWSMAQVEAVQIGLSPINVIGGSSAYPTGTNYDVGQFNAPNIFDFQSGSVFEPDQAENDPNGGYWLNGDAGPANAYIVIDLGSAQRIKRIEFYNTHNAAFGDRGTGNFTITGANAVTNVNANVDFDLSGPTSSLISGTLLSQNPAADPLDNQNFGVTNTNTFRYLRFNASSVASFGPFPQASAVAYGLNEMRIFATDVVTFNESMGPSQTNTTAPVTTQADPDPFRVVKNIVNNSGSPWNGFDMALEVNPGSGFVPSSGVDGISFDDPTAFATWAAGVDVLLNNVDQGPAGGTWDIDRFAGPDGLSFDFSGFLVAPGDTLSLQFDMRSTTTNQWQLVQTAQAVPEPSTIAIWLVLGAGGMGFVYFKRRKFR